MTDETDNQILTIAGVVVHKPNPSETLTTAVVSLFVSAVGMAVNADPLLIMAFVLGGVVSDFGINWYHNGLRGTALMLTLVVVLVGTVRMFVQP